MICRKSRLSAMYFVQNRKADNLHKLIKKHCVPGVIMYSDDAAMYTVKHGGRSQLCEQGYYHFWVNHSHQYTNDKFTFIQTGTIENSWARMKRQAYGIARVRNNGAIQSYLDAFSMRD